MSLDIQYVQKTAHTKRYPSPGVWANCPVGDIQKGMRSGIVVFDDFMNLPAQADGAENGDYFAVLKGSVTAIQHLTEPGGVLFFDAVDDSSDASEGYVQFGRDETIALGAITDNATGTSGRNYRTWFEARIQMKSVTALHSMFVGLAEISAGADNVLEDDGTGLVSLDHIGFSVLEVDADALEPTINDGAADNGTIVTADAKTMVADTWVKVGIYYDGTGVYFFVDGVQLTPDSSSNTASDKIGLLPASVDDFPDDVFMSPFFCVKSHDTTEDNLLVDWWKYAQLVT